MTAAQAIDAQFKGKQKFSRFKTILPPVPDAELMPLLDKFKVRVRAEAVQGSSLGSRILIGVLPWVLIIGVWWYIIRKAQQKGGIGGGLLQRFSKSGAQLYAREHSRVTFEDVAGLAEAKQELQEIISFLRNPEKFTRLGGGNDEREQTLNQLLSELDGFEDHSQVIVLAATNRPDVLDAALLRPGRFDRQVVIERPDWRDRVKILQVHTRTMPLADDVDLELIAKGTPGMVGADLQSLVNEAALIAAREDVQQVAMVYFDRAKDRQLMGMERKLFLSEEEKYITAIHEAGHALVAKALPGSDPVHKITIIPRGQALGLTQQLPEDDRYHYQRSYLLGRLSVMLAGRTAEKQCFGEYSTGAQNDLKQVMSLAEKMVCQWGMSDRLGPLSYPRGEEHPFLGRKMASEKNFSEKTAWIIDQEIEQLVNTADRCAHAIVAGNREILDALATLLKEEESLDRAAFERFLDEHPLVLPKQECCDVSFRNPPEATEEPPPHSS